MSQRQGMVVRDEDENVQMFYKALELNGPSPGSLIVLNREKEAAEFSIATGLYGSFRTRKTNKFGSRDCARIGPSSLCFCGHHLTSHDLKNINVKCKACSCSKFEFIPSRPEEIGEHWLPLRDNCTCQDQNTLTF
ncbi:hypothetical protein AKO1_000044 [Acrasis kona]|uniref:Uncharacterized protein n=1 Tax=Acrasis kona TaxID=1008807 RepID=A0AAW2ZGF7_9EUKA